MKLLTKLGGLATIIYLMGVGLLVFSRWEEVLLLDLNSIGDFFAGAVGPLALIWVILGFYQQGAELRLTTRALQQQVEELHQTVKHQENLVEISRGQFMAQIEASRREDLVRQLATKPVLVLSTLRFMSRSPGEPSYAQFRLRNYGARADKVELEIVGGTAQEFSPSSFQTLTADEIVEVNLWRLDLRDSGRYDVHITCLDALRNQHTYSFQLSFEAYNEHLAMGPLVVID